MFLQKLLNKPPRRIRIVESTSGVFPQDTGLESVEQFVHLELKIYYVATRLCCDLPCGILLDFFDP